MGGRLTANLLLAGIHHSEIDQSYRRMPIPIMSEV